MDADRREARRAARARVESCRARTAALQAGRPVTAADLARASQHLALAQKRAEQALRSLRDRQASHYRHEAATVASPRTRTPAAVLPKQLTAEEFAAWLRARGARLVDVAVHYLTIGGACSPFELDAFLNNALDLPDGERAVLRHALWELDEFHGLL
jgi:hypothetical protein